MDSSVEGGRSTSEGKRLDLGPSESDIDLETVVGALWSEGGTVPFPIASSITIGAAQCLRELGANASSPSVPYASLPSLRLSVSGQVRLFRDAGATSDDPLFDVGIVLWELLVGRRFSIDDFHANGDVRTLVATCTSERRGAPLGSLERRALAELDPIVSRALSRGIASRFVSLGSFVRALDAVMRPASSLRLAEWMRVVVGPRTRSPLVTPSPPSVRPKPSVRRDEARAKADADALDLALLEGLAKSASRATSHELSHSARTVTVGPAWWNATDA